MWFGRRGSISRRVFYYSRQCQCIPVLHYSRQLKVGRMTDESIQQTPPLLIVKTQTAPTEHRIRGPRGAKHSKVSVPVARTQLLSLKHTHIYLVLCRTHQNVRRNFSNVRFPCVNPGPHGNRASPEAALHRVPATHSSSSGQRANVRRYRDVRHPSVFSSKTRSSGSRICCMKNSGKHRRIRPLERLHTPTTCTRSITSESARSCVCARSVPLPVDTYKKKKRGLRAASRTSDC